MYVQEHKIYFKKSQTFINEPHGLLCRLSQPSNNNVLFSLLIRTIALQWKLLIF